MEKKFIPLTSPKLSTVNLFYIVHLFLATQLLYICKSSFVDYAYHFLCRQNGKYCYYLSYFE